jgi:hypothetical protein
MFVDALIEDIIHHNVFHLKQYFGYRTLPVSSGKLGQTDRSSPFGHQSQHEAGYVNQTQHKPPVAVKTNISKHHTCLSISCLLCCFKG